MLAVRVLQSFMLQSDDIIQPAMEALFQELSSAATWSLSTAALKSSNTDQQAPSLHSSAIMLIGLSRCLSSECVELPNICQDPLTDFTLSAWFWTSESSALVLQFKGQPAFFSVSIDSVRGIVGATEVRHDSPLEPNHWHLLTLTVKNRQLRLFIDDTLANQQTAVSAFPAFPTDIPLLLTGNVTVFFNPFSQTLFSTVTRLETVFARYAGGTKPYRQNKYLNYIKKGPIDLLIAKNRLHS
ncbi:hypothetical protein BVRB_025410 [Beta vulgaris subsp. vulgaris]|uniref:Laminin G domain-containing protein n=1 Tax=Beta vulgaris subsp. vulgaris TaxID=3555 RepID=A0A0J8AZ58_BETVV|nr:hypothetical protein BVRB_025410 [Beta vulgaris subsp. vulgaris]